MKTLQLVMAAGLLAASGTATAQSANEARCILLANAYAGQTKDAQQQKIAEDSLYFYLGRISGQPTAAQMKAAFDAQGKTLNDSNAGTLMGECVKAIQEKVQLLQTVSAQSQPAAPAPVTKPTNPQGR